jgi:hypothetical protein
MSYIYDLSSDHVWFVDRQLHREMFVGGIHTGSIAYRRHAWLSAARFPDIDLGEDVAFMRNAVGHGVRLLKLPNDAVLASCGGIEDGADLQFVAAMARQCADRRLAPSPPTCIYVRHPLNTWRFVCGKHLRPHAWHKVTPDRLLPAEDLLFYRTVAAAPAGSTVARQRQLGAPGADARQGRAREIPR